MGACGSKTLETPFYVSPPKLIGGHIPAEDSDDESQPGDSFKPGESPDYSSDDSDGTASDAEDARINRLRTVSSLPFDDDSWLFNMPRSPIDSLGGNNRANAVFKQAWVTPNASSDNLVALGEAEAAKERYRKVDDSNTFASSGSRHSPKRRGSSSRDPVKFVSFNDFRFNMKERKPRHEIPRCPEDNDILKDLSEAPNFNRSKVLIVYISHCYLAGFDGKKGNGAGAEVVSPSHVANWRRKPHPDNRNNHKFELIVEGIDFLIKSMATKVNNVYLWLDFSCLDQDKNPVKQLEAVGGLDAVMSMCDCVFTPIVDPKPDGWEYGTVTPVNWLRDYKSAAFRGSNIYSSYLCRAWCRLEMLYAAHTPLWTNEDEQLEKERCDLMSGGLYIAMKNGLRPHFLYGTKESASGGGLLKLPPLPKGFSIEFDPRAGSVTSTQDMNAIERQLNQLTIDESRVVENYTGERNSAGEKHGQGTFMWEDGSTYTGGWVHDKRHGTGCTFTLANGESIKGDWKDNHIDGYALSTNVNGDTYYGEFNEDNLVHGMGKMEYHDGDIYEGCFRDGMRHHKGHMRFKEGDTFVGYFRHNKMNGFGTWNYVGGGSFQGFFKNNRRHGEGTFSSSEGTIFEGNYVHGKKHGHGKMTYRDGIVLEGVWVDGFMEGNGVYTYADGSTRKVVYEGGVFRQESAKEKQKVESAPTSDLTIETE